MINIELSKNFSKWTESKHGEFKIYFSGYLQIGYQLYQEKSATKYIYKKLLYCNNEFLIEKLLNRFNGSWAIIIKTGQKIILATDIIRSIPIYYSMRDGIIYISNCTNILVQKLKLNSLINENMSIYISKFSAPPGKTIIKNLYDVEAGHFIVFENITLKVKKYWFMPQRLKKVELSYLLQKSSDIFNVIFTRLKIFFDLHEDKTILLPLSGGMDSRLLAWALKKYNVKNKIIAFTYGKDKNVEEARISRKVAKYLEIEWYFIKYSEAKWKNIRKDFDKIIRDFSNYKAAVHLQDFIAIKELSKIYPNSVVLPGLCFDGLAGLNIPNELKFKNYINEDSILNSDKSFVLKLSNYENTVKNFKWSSFVVNSVRTYEYFGLSYYLPFWDIDLTNFWYSVPTKYRIERNLFRLYQNDYAYKNDYEFLLNIPLASNTKLDNKIREFTAKDKVFTILRYHLKRIGFNSLLKKIIFRRICNDNFNMDYIGFYYLFENKDFGFNKYTKHYLELISAFIINQLKKKH